MRLMMVATLVLALAACGTSGGGLGDQAGTGGAPDGGSGGHQSSAGTGGAPSSTGGAAGSGGVRGTGGAVAGTGGAIVSMGTGGAVASTGGASGTVYESCSVWFTVNGGSGCYEPSGVPNFDLKGYKDGHLCGLCIGMPIGTPDCYAAGSEPGSTLCVSSCSECTFK